MGIVKDPVFWCVAIILACCGVLGLAEADAGDEITNLEILVADTIQSEYFFGKALVATDNSKFKITMTPQAVSFTKNDKLVYAFTMIDGALVVLGADGAVLQQWKNE